MTMYSLFWNIAQRYDPEVIHNATLQFLRVFPSAANFFSPIPVQVTKGFHIQWNNPFGIAAGLDKNAMALKFWDSLGLGCVEIGTVTPYPQYGNDLPRIFRLPHESLRNSMGFPNLGSHGIYRRISQFKSLNSSIMPIWINLGKQKDTSLTDSIKDYIYLIRQFSKVADALVINISSPNTIGLRKLQTQEYLESLLYELAHARNYLSSQCPLLLKVSPDENENFYLSLPSLLRKYSWQGVIGTNTTTQHSFGSGGVSGKDLFTKSYYVAQIMAPLCRELKLDYVFAGGISSTEDVKKISELKIQFFQIYTALIYQGPNIFKKLLDGLSK